jgi:hypothetical protein
MPLTKAKSNWYNNLSDFDLLDDFTNANLSNILNQDNRNGGFQTNQGAQIGRVSTTQKQVQILTGQAVFLVQYPMFFLNLHVCLLRDE